MSFGILEYVFLYVFFVATVMKEFLLFPTSNIIHQSMQNKKISYYVKYNKRAYS